jgi:tripartite-type tricarboxylate transporter receptor subunit TctC
VPTYAEVGLASNNDPSWFGLVAPAGTPAATVKRMQEAVAQAIKEPAVAQRLAGQGLFPSGTTPAAFAAQIGREIEKMKRISQFAKITLD